MRATIKVGDFVVSIPKGVVLDWRVEFGFEAPIQGWELPADTVEEILDAHLGDEVTVVFGGKTIERVLVIGNAPSRRTTTQILLLTDVRWYFEFGWTVKDANVRRRVGDTRLVGGDVVAATVVDTVKYAYWSLHQTSSGVDPVPFTYLTFTARVADEAGDGTEHPSVTFIFEGRTFGEDPTFDTDGLVIQETFLDDVETVGLARAISSLPGRKIYVDLDGVVRVVDAAPGAETAFVLSLPAALRPNKGSLRKRNKKAFRPESYVVLFDPEFEILFFAIPPSGYTTDNTNSPWMENVFRVPDQTLTVPSSSYPAARPSRVLAEGSYGTVVEVCAGWGAPSSGVATDPTVNSGSLFALTEDLIRQHFNDHRWFLDNFVYRGSSTADPVWAARIQEVLRHFRQLWRVNPHCWKRVKSVLPERVAIFDEATGTRAPAPVFCDSARQPTTLASWGGTGRPRSSFNARSWAAHLYPNLAVTEENPAWDYCHRANARVIVEDEDEGVFLIDWQPDTTGSTSRVAPSAVENDVGFFFADDHILWVYENLVAASSFNLAIIVSAVPGGPNDKRRLYSVPVTLGGAIATLNGTGIDDANSEGLGPKKYLRVRGYPTTARFPYLGTTSNAPDSDALNEGADLTLRKFGAVNTTTTVSVADDTAVTPTGSGDKFKPINLESELEPYAKALAAAHLVLNFDCWEGERETGIDFTLFPVGTVNRITHRISAKTAVTIVTASPGDDVNLDPISFLPWSARKILTRQVQP